jgi:large subunit ribosomal protein L13
VDADGKVLGRLTSQIAKVLRGKHKVSFTPHVDMGFGVIVVNADKIRVTGDKLNQKMYYQHSGYIGGLRSTSLREMLQTKPEQVIHHAVRGMLPKNRLGRKLIRRLKVYARPDHPHQAQKPEFLEFPD